MYQLHRSPLTILATLLLTPVTMFASLSVLPTYIPADGKLGKRTLTINPALQHHLQLYIRNRSHPVAAVVVIEVSTGNILAMVQGKQPQASAHQQYKHLHTALSPRFPAASLFKIVTSAAYLEFFDDAPAQGFTGSCGEVSPSGKWLNDNEKRKFSLDRAYALSCNSFYANIAVNRLSLGSIQKYASTLRFNAAIPADFYVPPSPLVAPQLGKTSAHIVGRYAAGFGRVGISAVHAAWISLVIANGGYAQPLRIFKDTPQKTSYPRILKEKTSLALLRIMRGTVRGGSASFAFKDRKYRKIRKSAGGKTGTLYSSASEGTNTWFTGIMPLDKPKIVVSAIVVVPHAWVIKGSNLAAEAFWYFAKENRLSIAKR